MAIYRLKADVTFEAYDIDGAYRYLGHHFLAIMAGYRSDLDNTKWSVVREENESTNPQG